MTVNLAQSPQKLGAFSDPPFGVMVPTLGGKAQSPQKLGAFSDVGGRENGTNPHQCMRNPLKNSGRFLTEIKRLVFILIIIVAIPSKTRGVF